MNVSQLQHFDPSGYTALLNAAKTAQTNLADAQRLVVSSGTNLTGSNWSGAAATAAVSAIDELGKGCQPALKVLPEVLTSLQGFLVAVTNAQQELQGALPVPSGYTLDQATGIVTAPPQSSFTKLSATTLNRADLEMGVTLKEVPDTDAYNAAVSKAASLTQTIQKALRDAEQADSELMETLDDATDVSFMLWGMANNTEPPSYLEGILSTDAGYVYTDTGYMMSLIAPVAATLLTNASHGDQGALQQFQSEYGQFGSNPQFTAPFLSDLGPNAIVNMPFNIINTAAGQGTVDGQSYPELISTFNKILYNALASASSTLPPSFFTQLSDAANSGHEYGGGDIGAGATSGWWSIGQIMSAAKGGPAFDPNAFAILGNGMIQWAKTNNPRLADGPQPPGIYDDPYQWPLGSGSDPLQGLMTAASQDNNAAAAQKLLSWGLNANVPNSTGSNQDDLSFLLSYTNWPDSANALGTALQHAALYQPGSQAGAEITAATVHDLALFNQSQDLIYGKQMSGLTVPVSKILAANIAAINETVHNPTDNYGLIQTGSGYQPGFTSPDLQRVLSLMGGNQTAYRNVQQAELNWMSKTLTGDVAGWQSSGSNTTFQDHLQLGTEALGFIGAAKYGTGGGQSALSAILTMGAGAVAATGAAGDPFAIPAAILSGALTVGAGAASMPDNSTPSSAYVYSANSAITNIVAQAMANNGVLPTGPQYNGVINSLLGQQPVSSGSDWDQLNHWLGGDFTDGSINWSGAGGPGSSVNQYLNNGVTAAQNAAHNPNI